MFSSGSDFSKIKSSAKELTPEDLTVLIPVAPPAKRRVWRLWFIGLLGTILLAWVVYKSTNTRVIPTPMAADTSCQSDASTVADMSQFTPGAAPIRCQPWDIGTGVTGYVWHAPNSRAVLLLQPGYGDYAHRYVKQNNQLIPHLLNAGISVYAFDMWGTGRSPGKRGVADVSQAVEDHLAARRKLKEQPLPVFLFGHSLGGLVTATSMVREQSGISGVILLAPAIKYGANAFLRFVARVGGFIMPTLPGPLPVGKIEKLTHVTEAQDRIKNDPLLYIGRITWVTLAGGAKIFHENWKLYPNVRVPVLALHGTADENTDPDGSRQLIETISSPDKTLHLIPDAYHAPLDDTDADQTLQVIMTWLQDRLPPSRP